MIFQSLLSETKTLPKHYGTLTDLRVTQERLGKPNSSPLIHPEIVIKPRQTLEANLLAKYEDIKILTSQSPQDRQNFVRQHARSISGTSQKAGSVSSDGIVDEEDEEPFSAQNSAVVAPGPKQDEPKRPQPGGRFPSQLTIDTLSQRGLQAPLSPSSGSSGFGDVQDRNVVAAAALPGSGVGHHYGANPSSPTHAALVNQQAQEDGINPYTSQPINDAQNHASRSVDGFAAAGIAAATGVVGSEAYRHHEDEKATAKYQKEQEQQAALESSTVAAPDTYEQESEQRAAHEAAIFAAPDVPLMSVASGSNFMSGGRSEGDLSNAEFDLTTEEHPHQPKGEADTTARPLESVLKPVTEDLARPSLAAGQNHQSVQSISELHVPGEFPRGNTESGDATTVVPG